MSWRRKGDEDKRGRRIPNLPFGSYGGIGRPIGGQLNPIIRGRGLRHQKAPLQPPPAVRPPALPGPAWGSASVPEAPVPSLADMLAAEDQQKKQSAIESQDDGSGAGTSLAQASGGQTSEQFAGMDMKTISKEVFRVNVIRGRDSLTQNWVVVRANTSTTGFGVNYNPNDRYDANGQYRVTVPAVMLFDVDEADRNNRKIDGQDYTKYQVKHLVNSYRHQAGSHLMVPNYGGVLAFHLTFWSKATEYHGAKYKCTFKKSSPIACVYPCLAAGGQRLVLGLGFCNERNVDEEPNPRIRTYGRKSAVGDEINDYCFDVTEEFITGSDPILSFRNDKLFPEEDMSTAFYVCRGAKLLVLDQRFEGLVVKANDKLSHCRSLFLEGSLVVVMGFFQTTIPKYEKETLDQEVRYWDGLLRDHVRPDYSDAYIKRNVENGMNFDTDLPDGTQLSDFKRKVIFLGATESEHNSVCWKLYMNKDDREGQRSANLPYLQVPEGGYIEDMTTWKYGFQLIRDRHRYERLFESVLEMANGTALPAEQYRVPRDQFVDRILGISADKRQAMICLKYEALRIPRDFENLRHDTDRDLRRYMGIEAMNQARTGHIDVKWIFSEKFKTQPRWFDANRHFLPSPPLYPNCFQRANDGVFEMLVVGPDLRIVNANDDHEGRRQKPNILSMEFKIVNADDGNDVMDGKKYKLYDFNHYGHLWQSRNDRNTPALSRLARDARWQTVDSNKAWAAHQPQIQGLLLVDKNLKRNQLPWSNEMPGAYHRFGYQDDYVFKQKL